jgi:hypothetical protein
MSEKKEGINCEMCKRLYKNSNSLRMHKCKSDNIERTDEILEALAALKNENKIMKDKLESLENTKLIKNITNNTDNSTNITNNITINAYGKENLDHLYEKGIKIPINVLKNVDNGIPKLAEMIFMDPNKPENQTVGVYNVKRKMFYYHLGDNKIGFCSFDEGLDKQISCVDTFMQVAINEDEDEIKKHISEKDVNKYNTKAKALKMSNVLCEDEEVYLDDRIIIASKESEDKEKDDMKYSREMKRRLLETNIKHRKMIKRIKTVD